MREANHRHIYVIPLAADNGIELEKFEPGLADAAMRLKSDASYGSAVKLTGKRYLSDGACLLHGDFTPGSWLRARLGPRVIDPEFCFYGDPEFDLGCAIAHLALARRDARQVDRFLESYGVASGDDMPYDPEWIARFAAAEVMRRLIGAAQLPIPPGHEWRAQLLESSRRAMLDADLAPLWEVHE